jgi:hypothetical protein
MIPCRFCAITTSSLGLKQSGGTRNLGNFFARPYRCLDCGAVQIWYGYLGNHESLKNLWFPPGAYRAVAHGGERIRLQLELESPIGACVIIPLSVSPEARQVITASISSSIKVKRPDGLEPHPQDATS